MLYEESDKHNTTDEAPVRSRTAVRGKHYNDLQQGTNLVIIDPSLLPYFPDSESVNRALRAMVELRESLAPKRTAKREPERCRSVLPRQSVPNRKKSVEQDPLCKSALTTTSARALTANTATY